VWLSIVTMTTVGYGDKAPRTLSGRIVAALWMFISIALISIFTGTVATLLTVEHVGSRIEGVEDLDRGKIACIKDSAAAQLLAERHLHCLQFDDLDNAIRAVADRRVDALVYDRALLAWSLKQRPDLPIKILPGTLWPEYYAFAMAPEEQLRRPIDEAMARILHGDRWKQSRFFYLGNQAERH
jgi:ABC-type amino acid transport substrate-binding protein